MVCPNNKGENRQGPDKPPEHKAAPAAQQPPTAEFVEYVTVFETGNPALITIAKSLLKNVGIPFNAKGEGPQTVFSGGLVQIQVPKQEAARAKELLEDLE